MIYCKLCYRGVNRVFDCFFVYGFNEEQERSQLWADLSSIVKNIDGIWFIGGDFNCFLKFGDRLGFFICLRDVFLFRNCVEFCDVLDMKYIGVRYMLNNK